MNEVPNGLDQEPIAHLEVQDYGIERTDFPEIVRQMLTAGFRFRWESVSRGMYGLPVAA